MTRFRSLLIFGLMTLAASGYLAAQEKPRREERSQQYPGKNPHLNNKESIRGGMSLYRRLCGECHALDATGYRGPNLIAYMANGAADEAMFQDIRKGVPGHAKCRRATGPTTRCCRSSPTCATWAPSRRPRRCRPATSRTAQQLFAKQCQNCHRVAGKGGRIGPDLSRIGAARTQRGARARDSHAARMDSAGLRDGHRRHEGRAEDSRRQEERRCVLDSGDGHARTHPGISEVERRSDATTRTR